MGGDLFAVDGPGRDGLAPQMDGVDHAGGDKGGLHAEKVGIGQVVVVAYAQSQNVTSWVLRGQRFDLVQGLVALGGDDAVGAVEAVFPQQAYSLSLQSRGGGAGLDLHVQADAAPAELQHLFQGGDPGVGKAAAEPAACVQLCHLGIGQIVDLCVFAGTAFQV